MAIAAKYFPRPLYPPDATPNYTPSQDGPDIVAYKRTLCRLGRWEPWNPALWDEAYSNAFAHGRGTGNVGDSGIAGFQRQMRVSPDTGFIGSKTFNMLASARVPAGRQHEGEMAMDANSCNLIMEAFQIYGGRAQPIPPPPTDTRTQRQRALDAAIAWLGYVEGSNNDTIFGDWYGMNHQPWCAMFCTYVYEVQVGGSPSFERASRYSYVPYLLTDARNNRYGLSITSSPIPGDLVTFDWQRDGVPDHVGFFKSGTAKKFHAIEGNTSPSDNSNGGMVMDRERSSSDATCSFIRVAEAA
jgi:hypothetical protein